MLSANNNMGDTLVGSYLRGIAHVITEPNLEIPKDQEYIQMSEGVRIRDWAEGFYTAHPDNPNAIFVLGRAYYTCGDADKAEELLTRAISISGHLAYILYVRGVVYLSRKSYDKAIADFDATLAENPNFSLAYVKRGEANTKIGNHKQAVKDYTKAIKAGYTDARIYFNRANSYKEMDSLPLAVLDLTRAIDKDSTLGAAYFERGLIYAFQRATDLSFEDYQAFVRYAPPEMKIDAVQIQKVLDTPGAKQMLAQQHPVEYYLQKGCKYFDAQNWTAALGYFIKALEKNHDFIPAVYWLAAVFDEIKDPKRAISRYDAAVSLAPNDADAYFMRARGFCRRSMFSIDSLVPRYKYEDALNDFARALELKPKKTEVYLWRGLTHHMNLQQQSASKDLAYFINHAGANDSNLVKVARSIMDDIAVGK